MTPAPRRLLRQRNRRSAQRHARTFDGRIVCYERWVLESDFRWADSRCANALHQPFWQCGAFGLAGHFRLEFAAKIIWPFPLVGCQVVITSLSRNGVLVATNLQPNSVAFVQWASSLNGPGQINWATLRSLIVSINVCSFTL